MPHSLSLNAQKNFAKWAFILTASGIVKTGAVITLFSGCFWDLEMGTECGDCRFCKIQSCEEWSETEKEKRLQVNHNRHSIIANFKNELNVAHKRIELLFSE